MQGQSRIVVFSEPDRSKEIMDRLLQVWKGEVREARSAEECLSLLKNGESDLVLLDSGLPESTGVELARRISQDPSLNNNVPLVLLWDAQSLLGDRIEKIPQALRSGGGGWLTRSERSGLAQLFLHSSDLFCTMAFHGSYERLNAAWKDLLGYTSHDLRGKPVVRFIHPDDRPVFEQEFNKLTQGEMTASFVARHVHKDGTYRWLHWSVAASPSDSLLLAVVHDLSREKWMEDQFQTLSRVVEQSPVSVMVTDRSGNIEYVNPKFTEISGYSAEELVGKNPRIMKSGKQPRELYEELWRTITAGEIWRGVLQNKKKSGELFWEYETIAPVRDTDGVIAHFVSIKEDITERRSFEETIRSQAALLDAATDAILIRQLDGRILFWNKGAEKVYGWTAGEAVGKRVSDLIYPNDRELRPAMEALVRDGQWRGEMHQRRKDGQAIITESRWTLAQEEDMSPRVLSINIDITEKKRLEAQFLRAQRMESIGTLAGGIAHDLNNILGPILLSIDFLRTRYNDPQSERVLSALETSAHRGADLVRQVLMFARGAEGERVTLHVAHIIKDVTRILEETFPRKISIVSDLPNDIWTVPGDPTQLHQVLMNLCVNARDAMPEGGQIRLSAENTFLDEHYVRSNLEAQTGPYVVITVADTGAGIPPEVLPRIFDPFYTTKEAGKGTGIGLSTVRAIVKGHGGFINVYTEPGRGSIFKVFLPAGGKVTEKAPESVVAEIPRGTGELVLVVDDEAAILEVTKSSLEAFGYRVLTAADGTEALAVYSQHRDEVKVVITDMMMPYLDGPATIRALRRIDPRVKIVAASGLEVNAKVSGLAGQIAAFLPKPYTAERLLRTLAEVLGRTAA